jgi:DNA-dependent metalloprotease WSS1
LFRLSHIVVGPHNEEFHKLWNQLRSEHESLVSKGYTGEGFLSTGHHLGGKRIPMHEARRLARAAAERRRIQHTHSGQRVGGAGPAPKSDIRKVIADAAQRRIDISKGCASTNTDDTWKDKIVEETSKNETRTKGEIDDEDVRAIEQAFIEMIQEDDQQKYGSDSKLPKSESAKGVQGFREDPMASSSSPRIPNHTKPKQIYDLTQGNDDSSGPEAQVDESWTCSICTLKNPLDFLCCDACGVERPYGTVTLSAKDHSRQALQQSGKGGQEASKKTERVASSLKYQQLADAIKSKPLGWNCQRCGAFMENEWWTCSSCGLMKSSS